jgi:hypothetical protein
MYCNEGGNKTSMQAGHAQERVFEQHKQAFTNTDMKLHAYLDNFFKDLK